MNESATTSHGGGPSSVAQGGGEQAVVATPKYPLISGPFALEASW